MPRNNSKEERLTEDEIARRKLGPRGVPGGEDSAKMTNRKRTFRRKGNLTATSRSFRGPRRAGRARPLLAFQQISSLGARKPSGGPVARQGF